MEIYIPKINFIYIVSLAVCLYFLREFLVGFVKAKKRSALVWSEAIIAVSISFIPGINSLIAIILIVGLFY